jgi:coronin-1B/1C/6
MSKLPRKSKVRHVFHQPVKNDQTYTGIRPTNKAGPHQFIKANTKYFALAEQAGGGGPLLVRKFNQTGKLLTGHKKITGHSSAVFDFDWNPFHEQLLVAGDEAAEIMLWGIPDGDDGLTEDLHTPLQKFPGHRKKVSFVLFNPCADSVIASASWDNTVKIWDMKSAACKFTISDSHKKPITDLKWNYDGSLVATTCQDKKSRFFDPRAATPLVAEFQAHKGGKPSKNCFLGDKQMMITVGFTKQSKREFKFWDIRNLSEPAMVNKIDIDQSAGMIWPFYDAGLSLLFFAGKGDGNIRLFEVTNTAPYAFPVTEARSTDSTKGICMVPKRALDVISGECARFMKVTAKAVVPMPFVVPRKVKVFHNELFPDDIAGVPSTTLDEWCAGENKPPVLMSLDPDDRAAAPASAAAASGGAASSDGSAAGITFTKSAAELQKELDAALKKIAKLEKKVAELEAAAP